MQGELDLLSKQGQYSSNLSGGQQRRLSLAVSLIGAPKVVLLDEPTTGLDPANRRRVWKVLQEQKKVQSGIVIPYIPYTHIPYTHMLCSTIVIPYNTV